MPQITFGFLICGYLPGVPLALAIYFCLVIPMLPLDISTNTDYWTAYMLIAPLIFGLLLDGIRHGVALIFSDLPIFAKFLWKDMNVKKMKKGTHGYEEAFFSRILETSSTYYHIFEFSINTALSSVFAWIVAGLFTGQWVKGFSAILISLTIISLLVAVAFKKDHDRLIKIWFP